MPPQVSDFAAMKIRNQLLCSVISANVARWSFRRVDGRLFASGALNTQHRLKTYSGLKPRSARDALVQRWL
jgi:hypothetical protein